ncbi:hypothetical protein AN958_03404 [Leucoagaricus sp. SymC.cos]|nr:hypothetical protein AN958_03404 [Leucoagaricus sp. SymC.cos]
MATSPAHRSTRSMSNNNNLQTPSPGSRPRRLTSPSQTSLSIPEGHPQQFARPPSPLRNGFIPDTGTGIDPHDVQSDSGSGDSGHDEDDRNGGRWGDRSPSPSSSVSQLAASFAQRVGTLVEGIKSRSQLPTDEELEAEAQRERDRSRREAEAILTKEAEQRRLVEERVLAMMDNTKSLPPPPSRTSGPAMSSSNPPSPSPSTKEKEGGGGGLSWWTAAKNRLTPTKDKESLTPAQQVIQDAKAREKEQKRSIGKGKEKATPSEWPASSQAKFSDPSFNNLNLPPVSPQGRPAPGSPVSPTPSRPNLSNMVPNLTPSPMRSVDNLSVSPSREAPPLYAQFNEQGTLDIAGTLITIAKRFEKLEKWTVGHVRALEERMNDVERWLVDKEKEREVKEKQQATPAPSGTAPATNNTEINTELGEIRDEVSELQGRVTELGREMAKIAIAPPNLSSGPSRQSPTVISSASPTNSLIATQYHHHSPSSSISMSAAATPGHSRLHSTTARESTSPPMASLSTPGGGSKNSGTRFPYPTGDYTSLNHHHPQSHDSASFSPPSSPPSSNSKSRSMSITGLPTTSTNSNNAPLASSITRAVSPTSSLTNLNLNLNPPHRGTSPSSLSSNLPPPKQPQQQKRQTSVSPTPRKRYTVALGEPLRSQSPPADDPVDMTPSGASAGGRGGFGQQFSFGKSLNQTSIGSAMFGEGIGGGGEESDGPDAFGDETIGKSAALRLVGSSTSANNNSTSKEKGDDTNDVFSSTLAGGTTTTTNTTNPRPPRSRPRPQSTYTFGSSNTTLFQHNLAKQSSSSLHSLSSHHSSHSSISSSMNPPTSSFSAQLGATPTKPLR